LPWLLDPTDEDRSHIGSYDGAAAVLVFFALNAGILGILLAANRSPDAPLLQTFVAYAIAGAITVLLFLLTLVRRGVPLAAALGLRPAPGTQPRRAVLVGAAVGLLTGGLGLAYACVVRSTGWIDLPPPLAGNRVAILPLAVIAAPLVEEVLFRGLLFQGLLRSLKLPVAVLWSAGVFAAVHPMVSWPPVFVLGAAAAIVFHRTRYLPAAIAVHAVYNLVVIALQP
jgi:membrane protease YdiL (CAAX protease family)